VRLDVVTFVDLLLLLLLVDWAVALDVLVLDLLAGLVRHADPPSENFNLSIHQT